MNFYVTLAQRYPGAVLELACGSGQLIVPIAAKSTPAVGLDNSPEMLAAARRRAHAAGVRVEFVEGDMRKFELGQQFSLIFIARNSLLHLSEQDEFAALFDAVRHHLSPDGVLAFDIFKPNLSMRGRPSTERFPVMRVASQLYGEIGLRSRRRVITIRFRKSIVRPGSSPLQNSTMHGLRRCACDGSFHRNYLLFSRRTDSVWSAEMATIPVAISPVQADYRCVNVDLPDGGFGRPTKRCSRQYHAAAADRSVAKRAVRCVTFRIWP